MFACERYMGRKSGRSPPLHFSFVSDKDSSIERGRRDDTAMDLWDFTLKTNPAVISPPNPETPDSSLNNSPPKDKSHPP